MNSQKGGGYSNVSSPFYFLSIAALCNMPVKLDRMGGEISKKFSVNIYSSASCVIDRVEKVNIKGSWIQK